MSILVGVVEDDEPNRELLGTPPGVRYLFIGPDSPPPSEALAVDALLVWDVSSSFLRENWSRLRQLRWVHVSSAGVDRVLFPELAASAVVLTNSRYVYDQALAEYTIGLLLCLTKDFRTTFTHQAEHRWVKRDSDTMAGKVVVMLGVGPIARRTARMAKALGMVVRGIGRSARTADPDFGDIAAPSGLGELFAEADYVVIILPRTPQTEGIVDAAALAALKPTARLVNVGRAATLDQEALCAALREGRLAGAALDVMTPEPLPAGAPLWDVPNLLISPHMSGDHPGWRVDVADQFLRNLERWQRAEPMLNVVDKSLGYAPAAHP